MQKCLSITLVTLTEEIKELIRNSSTANLEKSGNSDVDVNLEIHIDNTPIAFAMLCSLYASKQLTLREFNTLVQKLEELRKYSGQS